MSADTLKSGFLPKFLAAGEPKFYRFLILYAMNKLIHIEKGNYKGKSPELEFIDYYDQFLILYRREGEIVYLDLARIFRRAGNKMYRCLLKKEMIEKNDRFLNIIK
jgi:hypothetical protein